MNRLLFAALLLPILYAQPQASPLKGVWRQVELTVTGPDARTVPAQPGLIIFTEKYFSMVLISGDKPRSEPDASKATDAEILASWRPFVA